MSIEIIVEDLHRYGIAGAAIASVDESDLQKHCKRSWQEVEGALRTAGYPLPVPEAAMKEAEPLRGAACGIAAFYVLTVRGYDPTSAADAAIRTAFEDAQEYLTKVAKKQVIPFPLNSDGNPIGTDPVVSAETSTSDYAVTSDSPRGW